MERRKYLRPDIDAAGITAKHMTCTSPFDLHNYPVNVDEYEEYEDEFNF